MPVTRMEAARDIQYDVLSVLKRISKYTVDTLVHTLWNLLDRAVFFRYGQLNQFHRQYERAMQSCLDGQEVAAKQYTGLRYEIPDVIHSDWYTK